MSPRRDNLQSHQFMLQRLVSAVVEGDTDPPRPPFKRAAGAVFGSAMVAAVAVAGIAVYGLLTGNGGENWRSDRAIVIEKESGTRYVYRNSRLYPVANYTSALLLGASNPVSVPRSALDGTPRGGLLGILGAPDAVPLAGALSRSPWSLCVNSGERAGQPATTVLSVAAAPAGSRALGESGLLVQAGGASGPMYLIWHGRRFPVADPVLIPRAFAWLKDAPIVVTPGWLNALPAGATIARLSLPDQGRPSVFRYAPTGSVFVVRSAGGGVQYYAALVDGLAEVTALQADLLLGDPRTNPGNAAAVQIQASEVVLSRQSLLPPAGPTRPPDAAPALLSEATIGGSVCAVFPVDGQDPAVVVGADRPEGLSSGDEVVVASGAGALAIAVGAPGAPTGTMVLVLEPGIAYPVPPDALPLLGYQAEEAVRLPSSLIGRIPLGPVLDPVVAGRASVAK